MGALLFLMNCIDEPDKALGMMDILVHQHTNVNRLFIPDLKRDFREREQKRKQNKANKHFIFLK